MSGLRPPEWYSMLRSVRWLRAAARAWPAVPMQVATCPNNRDVHSNQTPMCFSLLPRPRSKTAEPDPAVKPARAVEEARRLDEHRDGSNHADAKRSGVFELRPYNVANEPRAVASQRASAPFACYAVLANSSHENRRRPLFDDVVPTNLAFDGPRRPRIPVAGR